MLEEEGTACVKARGPGPIVVVHEVTSTGRAWPATITVLVTGGLGEGASGNEGETTCTTGESLDGEGARPGDTIIPGDVLEAGEAGNCPPVD